MILLSDHSKERLRERLGCSDAKMPKLATKAWKSVEPVNPEDVNESRRNRAENRKLMGQFWVWVKNGPDMLLVTVMPSSTKARNNQELRKLNVKHLAEIFRGIQPGS